MIIIITMDFWGIYGMYVASKLNKKEGPQNDLKNYGSSPVILYSGDLQ